MSSSIFDIGLSALNAAQAGILVTGHNIANASTPGFSRQQVVQTTNTPMATGAGFFGQGVDVQTVKRIYSASLSGQLLSAQNSTAEMNSYQAQITQVANLLADPNSGLTPAMSAFFNGVQQVSANPADIPSRQALFSNAQSLVSTFQSLDQQLSAIRTGTDAQITSEVSLINSYAQQIAAANQSIIMAQGNGTGQPANDLLDQRDQLVSQLNQEVKVSTVTQSDGTYTVFIGNGQPLVVGDQVSKLVAVPATDEPQKITVALQGATSSSPITLQESALSGGTLGGLLSFRSQSLDPTENALGRIATAVAQTFNDQHVLGQDLNGAPGGKFFTVPAPVVNANSLNAGSATLGAQIVNSDYRLDVSGGKYVVTRLSDGSNQGSFAPGAFPVTLDGITLSLGSGTTTNGDSFVVRPGNPAGSRVIASSGNAAGAAAPDSTASNIQSLEGSDYRLSYIATNTFTLTRLSDNTAWTAGGSSIATALANLAAQHQTGVTLTVSGTPAVGDSFMIEPTRNAASGIAVAISDPSSIAVAAPIRSAGGTANMGTATISAPTVYDKSFLPLTGTGAATLSYNSGSNQFTVTGPGGAGTWPAVAAITYVSGQTINLNGMSFSISGTPQNGDTFTVGNNTGGVSDNSNALLLGQLQTQNTLLASAGGSATASYQSAYSQIVSQVGNKAREVQVTSQGLQALTTQAQTARDSASAVNLDEEAANLMQYQQAYQAAAKMVTVASKLFDTLLAI